MDIKHDLSRREVIEAAELGFLYKDLNKLRLSR